MALESLAEERLGFRVPRTLLEFFAEHAELLSSIRCTRETGAGICLSEEDVCDTHEAAVEASLCVEAAPPAWLKKYIAIGADGGGGYYFVKRTGSLRVWMLDSDWYGQPKLVAKSLRGFARQLLRGDFPCRNLQWWRFWVE